MDEVPQVKRTQNGDGLSSIEIEIGDPDTLMVFFGGIQGKSGDGMGLPPFEFKRVSAKLSCTKLYIRDIDQRWYQGSLRPHWAGIGSIVSYIEGVRNALGAKRVVLVGNSMGGYAALAVAAGVRPDHVIAFSPISFISPALRLWHRDPRWYRQIAKAWMSSTATWSTFDVRRRLLEADLPPDSIHVYYAEEHRLDAVHAERLSDVAVVHAYADEGHNIVRALRDRGELDSVLASAAGQRA